MPRIKHRTITIPQSANPPCFCSNDNISLDGVPFCVSGSLVSTLLRTLEIVILEEVFLSDYKSKTHVVDFKARHIAAQSHCSLRSQPYAQGIFAASEGLQG